MKHYGDITKLNGHELPIVDVVTGGSPCQDLSCAGKRAGLSGERSGLFMEQIRLTKEMRDECVRQIRMRGADVDQGCIRPRYMVWENVPGAFSSNKGEDFRAVLEETARVADKDAVIPGPPAGKWQPAGCIVGDGWSLAWRVHDAQYWGVPQRRKRICLLADFNGQDAGRVLFELRRNTDEIFTKQTIMDLGIKSRYEIQPISKGLSGDIEESGKAGQNAAGDTGAGIEETGRAVVYGISAYDSNSMKSGNPHSGIYEADTSRTLDLNGGSPACNQGGMAVVYNGAGITSPINASNPKPGDPCHTLTDDSRNYLVQGADMYNGSLTGDIAATLNATSGDSPTHSDPSVVCLEGNGSRPSHRGDGYSESETMYTLNSTEHHAVAIENHPADSRVKVSEDGIVQTLSSRMGTGGGNVPMVMEPVCVGNDQLAQARLSPTVGTLNCMHDQQAVMTYGLDRASFNQGENAKYDFSIEEEVIGAQVARGPGAGLPWTNSVVRRLTPLECTRLQGFPDGWVDIGEWVDSKGKVRKESDAPKYKALGNSIALPFWQWLAGRIRKQYSDNNKITMASLFSGIGGFELVFAQVGIKPVWASEVEDFAIAVTKKHFPDTN